MWLRLVNAILESYWNQWLLSARDVCQDQLSFMPSQFFKCWISVCQNIPGMLTVGNICITIFQKSCLPKIWWKGPWFQAPSQKHCIFLEISLGHYLKVSNKWCTIRVDYSNLVYRDLPKSPLKSCRMSWIRQ